MDPEPGSSILIELLIIAACLLFSAAFSGSETAITSFSELKAKHLIERLGRQARIMEFWLRSPTRVLTTILVGNNAVNILGSAVATSLVLRMFPQGGVPLATVIMTISILLFSEVIPKTFAKANAEQFVLPALRFVRVVHFLFRPAVVAFAWTAEKALNLFSGGRHRLTRPSITEEELSFLINISEEEGALEQEKRKLLENVFQFGETIVREVMIPRPDMIAVSSEVNANVAAQILLEKGHSRLPVYEERLDNVIGIVHVKDILRKVREKKSLDFSVKEVLREPIFVPETKSVHELLAEMRKKKRQMAIVVDEHGGTAGLITFEDLIEEIVGEVRDEYDEQEEDMIQEIAPGKFSIDARLNFSEFVAAFEDQLVRPEREDEDDEDEEDEENGTYDTVGGFVTEKLGHIPRVGESVQFWNLTLTVKDAGRRRVKKMELQLTAPEAQGAERAVAESRA